MAARWTTLSTLVCSYGPCSAVFCTDIPSKKYCSDTCRAKASNAKRFAPWMGKRSAGRNERRKWYDLLRELKTLGYDRAKEVVRLALAQELVKDL